MAIGGSSGGGAGAIRAGRAFVEMFAEDSRLRRTLASWSSRLSSFAGFVSKLGAGMIGGGAAILAPLTAIFTATVDHLDALDEAATRLGTTPEVFDALAKSAKMAGIESEALESSVSRMQVTLASAAGGGKEASDALAALGLNAKSLISLPLDEQLAAIADGLEGIDNAAMKVAAARGVFGKGGASMLPLLGEGGGGLQANLGKFRNPALNDAAKSAAKLNDAFDVMKMSIKGAVGSLAFGFLDLAGPIETVAVGITDVAKSARVFIRENSAIVVGVALAAAALVAGGVAFVGLGGAISLVSTAISGFGALIGAVVGLASSPVAIAIIAVGALAAGLAYLWSTTADGQGALGRLKSGAGELAASFAAAGRGIMDALSAGDLALAGQIAFTTLKLEFTKMLGFWQDRWNAFKGFFVDGWHDAIMLIRVGLSGAVKWMETLFIDLGQSIRKSVGESFTNVLKEILQKYIGVMEATNLLGVNNVQLIAARNLMRGLDLSPGDAEGAKDRAERDHQDRLKRIHDEARAAQEARNKAREEDKKLFDDKIRRLQEEADALNALAADNAFQQDLFDATRPDIAKGVAELNRMGSLSAEGKGGFGGPLRGQFAVGDTISNQQLDTLKSIDEGVGNLPRDIGGEFANALRME